MESLKPDSSTLVPEVLSKEQYVKETRGRTIVSIDHLQKRYKNIISYFEKLEFDLNLNIRD